MFDQSLLSLNVFVITTISDTIKATANKRGNVEEIPKLISSLKQQNRKCLSQKRVEILKLEVVFQAALFLLFLFSFVVT